MGIFFRKSVKMGPIRFNLSKSGIGTSVGVKGLRVGVNATGKSYVSGGMGGIYFRNSLSPSNNRLGTSVPPQSQIQSSSVGFIIIFVLLVLFGLVFPPLLIVAATIGIIQIVTTRRKKLLNENLESYKKNFLVVLNENNLVKIKNELYKLGSIAKSVEGKNKILLELYPSLMVKIFEDEVINQEEEEIIQHFLSQIPENIIKRTNINIVNDILKLFSEDNSISKSEEDLIVKCISIFKLQEIEGDIRKTINNYRVIESINKEGLKAITPSINIENNIDCYYDEGCVVKKTQTIKGDKNIIEDYPARLLISLCNLHIVGQGHKKIKITNILSIRNIYDKTLELILENRKTPIYFSVDNPIVVVAIVQNIIDLNTTAPNTG